MEYSLRVVLPFLLVYSLDALVVEIDVSNVKVDVVIEIIYTSTVGLSGQVKDGFTVRKFDKCQFMKYRSKIAK